MQENIGLAHVAVVGFTRFEVRIGTPNRALAVAVFPDYAAASDFANFLNMEEAVKTDGKTYSVRSNAARAARKVMGKNARIRVDFRIEGNKDAGYRWFANNQRANTKQALIVGMLSKPGGVTAAEIAHAMNWQQHTVRGFLHGTLKGKLGLPIKSEQTAGKPTVYSLPA